MKAITDENSFSVGTALTIGYSLLLGVTFPVSAVVLGGLGSLFASTIIGKMIELF